MTQLEFGKRIADLREKVNLTQAELAEKLSVSAQAVSKWENGGGYPDVETIPQIAKLFETTTDYLFGCVKKENRVFCFNVCAGKGGGNTGVPFVFAYDEKLNQNYLQKGWHIVSSELSSEEESTFMLVVIERDILA